MVHTRLKPCCSFASFNFLILSSVRLSVINIFLTFKTFLLIKTLHLSAYCSSFTIMGLDFLLPPSLLKTLILCVGSICSIFIPIFMSDFKDSITKLSVLSSLFSLILWIKRRFLRKYYSCLASFTSKFSNSYGELKLVLVMTQWLHSPAIFLLHNLQTLSDEVKCICQLFIQAC